MIRTLIRPLKANELKFHLGRMKTSRKYNYVNELKIFKARL